MIDDEQLNRLLIFQDQVEDQIFFFVKKSNTLMNLIIMDFFLQ